VHGSWLRQQRHGVALVADVSCERTERLLVVRQRRAEQLTSAMAWRTASALVRRRTRAPLRAPCRREPTSWLYSTARSGGGSEPPAKISCACGRCTIEFSSRQNRLTMECACKDCYQASEWAASNGGPACPQIPRLSYWENDLLDVTGEEQMQVFMLRDKLGAARAQSQRCVATCCYSTLLVDHPAYSGNVCMIFEHAVSLSASAMPIDARIYMCDYDERLRGRLPAAPEGCPVTDKGPSVAGLTSGRFSDRPFQMPPLEPRRGTTMQDLFARLKRRPCVLGLAEGEPISNIIGSSGA
jgi:hypothetical protein